jgi:hypothetical protein
MSDALNDFGKKYGERVQRDIGGYIQELDRFLLDAGYLLPGQSVSQASVAHNNYLDAFRHAYVSGRIAMDHDRFTALTAGRRHEESGRNPDGEKRMDLHNNHVGVNYGMRVYQDLDRSTGARSQDPVTYDALTGKPKDYRLFYHLLLAHERGELITHPTQENPNRGRLLSNADVSGEIAESNARGILTGRMSDGGSDHPYKAMYANVMKALEKIQMSPDSNAGKEDIAAALVKAGAQKGFEPQKSIELLSGKAPGEIFISQGAAGSPTGLVAKVDVNHVQPYSASVSMDSIVAQGVRSPDQGKPEDQTNKRSTTLV